VGLLISVWLVAIVGITLKLLLPGQLDRLAVVFYLLLGWSGAVFYEPVAAALPSLSLWLLAAGGILTRQASSFMCGRNCGFKTRSGMASYWSPHAATIPPFSPVWCLRGFEPGCLAFSNNASLQKDRLMVA